MRPIVYELSGVTLLVVEPDERLRSELVLDLFMQGACVLVAERVDEALELMRAVRIDCALAAPLLVKPLRQKVADVPGISHVPVVARGTEASSAERVAEA